jgi:hypothetical protein
VSLQPAELTAPATKNRLAHHQLHGKKASPQQNQNRIPLVQSFLRTKGT